MAEGNYTENEIGTALIAQKIAPDIAAKYVAAFDVLGVRSIDDLKMIATEDEFKELMHALTDYFACKSSGINVTFMDRVKVKKVWKALVPAPVCSVTSECAEIMTHATNVR